MKYHDMAVNCHPWAYYYTVKGTYAESATLNGFPGKAAKTYYQTCLNLAVSTFPETVHGFSEGVISSAIACKLESFLL